MRLQSLNKKHGFTLLELLVVLVILGLLASIAAPQALKYLSKAKSDTAKLQIEALASNINFYHIDTGYFPTREQGLKVLVEKPANVSNWTGPYVTKSASLIDPWGEPYKYIYPGKHGIFDIYSYGADKKVGGDGENRDVGSWQ